MSAPTQSDLQALVSLRRMRKKLARDEDRASMEDGSGRLTAALGRMIEVCDQYIEDIRRSTGAA